MTRAPHTTRKKLPSLSIKVAAIATFITVLPFGVRAESPIKDSNLQAADQRLMDSERALLQALSARTFANSGNQSGNVVKVPAPEVLSQKQQSEKPRSEKQQSEVATMEVKPAAVVTKTTASAAVAIESEVPAKIVKKSENPAVSVKPETQKKPTSSGEVEILKNSNSNLRRELQTAQQRIEELEKSLDQSRSQLALAETELTRVSARLDSKNRASLGKYNLPMGAAATSTSLGSASQPSSFDSSRMRAPVSEVKPPAANTEMPIATVAVDKADLRLGPGKNHSPLMAVPRGSRLVVETRQGEWYRVFAPSGERAWIQAGMVLFGDGASLLNDGTAARVKGFNANDEDEAFRRVQRITAGQ